MTAERPAGTGHPSYTENHPRTEKTATAARRLVRAALAAWGFDHLTERGELVITELVANAVKHTSSPLIGLVVERPDPDRVRFAVVDRAPKQLPILRLTSPEDTSGRGLVMVEAYSDRWGYDLMCSKPGSPWGKTVWSELKAARQ